MKINFKLLLLLSGLIFIACESDDPATPKTIEKIVEVEIEKVVEKEITPDTKFENGFFVSAEGNFGQKNGSIAFVENDFATTTNFVYQKVNDGAKLAGLIQSVAFNDENAYVILNDVNTIVIADKVTLKNKAIVTSGLKNPRYMTIIGDKGYITNWGEGADETDDYVAILDLTTNKIEDNIISLANGVEQIVAKDNKLYISHKGAFSSNNIISVVDLNNNNSVSTITVKDNPDELFFSKSGQLVVLSEGKPSFDMDFNEVDRTTSAISFIDTSTNTVVKELAFPAKEKATLLAYGNESDKIFYYKDDSVFEITETATDLTLEGIKVGNIYGMNVKDNNLYTVSFSFTSFSTLSTYDTTSKSKIFSSSVGLGASKIYF